MHGIHPSVLHNFCLSAMVRIPPTIARLGISGWLRVIYRVRGLFFFEPYECLMVRPWGMFEQFLVILGRRIFSQF